MARVLATAAIRPTRSVMMQHIGKYEVVRELGRGATSEVYLATDPFTGGQVAIKLVKKDALGDHEPSPARSVGDHGVDVDTGARAAVDAL